MSRLLRILVVTLLTGCAAAPTPRRPPILSMQVDVLLKDGQALETLAVQHTLPAGARYAVRVLLAKPAYLYLVRVAGALPLEVLYPSAGVAEQSLKPGAPVHLPAGDNWLNQSGPGSEEFVLLAAPAPLSQEQVRSESRRPTTPPLGKVRGPEKPPVREGTRGDVIEVPQDGHSVTVIRFPFSRTGP